jgi:hypothetical protein
VIKIQDRAFEKPLELLLMKDQKVIQAFSSHAQEKTLTHSIRLRGSIWRSKHLDATGSCHSCKIRPELLVIIPDEVFWGLPIRRRFPQRYAPPKDPSGSVLRSHGSPFVISIR